MIVKNLTISIPEALMDRLRLMAAAKKQSVNRFVGDVLRQAVHEPGSDWGAAHVALFEEIQGLRSDGPWEREEIYRHRVT